MSAQGRRLSGFYGAGMTECPVCGGPIAADSIKEDHGGPTIEVRAGRPYCVNHPGHDLRPPCPRCGEPMQPIATPTPADPDAWVFGCGCEP